MRLLKTFAGNNRIFPKQREHGKLPSKPGKERGNKVTKQKSCNCFIFTRPRKSLSRPFIARSLGGHRVDLSSFRVDLRNLLITVLAEISSAGSSCFILLWPTAKIQVKLPKTLQKSQAWFLLLWWSFHAMTWASPSLDWIPGLARSWNLGLYFRFRHTKYLFLKV